MDIAAILADASCLACVIEELARSDSAIDLRLADILARANAIPDGDHAGVLGLVSEHWDLRITTAMATCMQDQGLCQPPTSEGIP
jgi:hypothetical protein